MFIHNEISVWSLQLTLTVAIYAEHYYDWQYLSWNTHLRVSASFTEACPAVFQSTRRWRPALPKAVFVSCSLCLISHCVTICRSKASHSLRHSSSAALAFTHQTCQRQMVVALRCFHKCQGIQTLCILCFRSHLFTYIALYTIQKQLPQ